MIRRLLALLTALTLALAPGPAAAQLLLTGVGAPSAGGGGGGLTLTYRGAFASATNQSTPYTQVAADLGSASADRIVVVALQSLATTTANITSVTIGGVSATKAIDSPTAVPDTVILQFWYAAVPSGTTGDIVVTPTADVARMGMVWWTITGTTQTTYADRSGAAANGGTNTTSVNTGSFTVPTGGVSMAMGRFSTSTPSSPTLTLVGGGAVNARHSASVAGESQYMIAADSSVVGSIQWNVASGTTINTSAAALAWGP